MSTKTIVALGLAVAFSAVASDQALAQCTGGGPSGSTGQMGPIASPAAYPSNTLATGYNNATALMAYNAQRQFYAAQQQAYAMAYQMAERQRLARLEYEERVRPKRLARADANRQVRAERIARRVAEQQGKSYTLASK